MELDRFYPLILDSMSEGVFTVDPDFRVTFLNRAAERIVGLSRDEALGRRCYEVFKADICQTSCALRQTLATGKALHDQRATILNSRMDEIPVCLSTGVLLDDEGQMVGGVEVFRDISDLEFLRQRLHPTEPFHGMVGSSPAMQALFSMLPDVGASETSVLIVGESGTGKELVARALHDLSRRKEKPFVALNCAAFPDSLLESELFGTEKGAYTGADRARDGLFVQANRGTLFLDEIGDVSPSFQAKLLRVLQEGKVRPLGADRPRSVDVRVVAATNRDLRLLMAEGRIRPDFFYRISVLPLTILPLRERREDIVLLARHYLKLYALRHGKAIDGFTPRALGVLRDHDYPGNVRELMNVLERAVVLCHGDRIGVEVLPRELLEPRHRLRQDPPLEREVVPPAASAAESAPSPRAEMGEAAEAPAPGPIATPAESVPLQELSERSQLLAVLKETRWNRTEAALRLKMGRTTLWRKMKRYNLL